VKYGESSNTEKQRRQVKGIENDVKREEKAKMNGSSPI